MTVQHEQVFEISDRDLREPIFTATRLVCQDWLVHPIFCFGPITRKLNAWAFKNPGAGAPYDGVQRFNTGDRT